VEPRADTLGRKYDGNTNAGLSAVWFICLGGHSRFSLVSPSAESPLVLVFETTLELRDDPEMVPDCDERLL